MTETAKEVSNGQMARRYVIQIGTKANLITMEIKNTAPACFLVADGTIMTVSPIKILRVVYNKYSEIVTGFPAGLESEPTNNFI